MPGTLKLAATAHIS